MSLVDEQIATFANATVDNYVSCLVSYCDYAKKTLGIDPVYSQGPRILKWMAELRQTGISNSRLQHHHSALKTFFALLCKLKNIWKNPADIIAQRGDEQQAKELSISQRFYENPPAFPCLLNLMVR